MQSGRRNTRGWLMVFETDARRPTDPLMGWVGSLDTRSQLRMHFDSREEAVAFAERNGLTYEVQEPRTERLRPKSYAENFRV
ncbi:MAG: ETC complex I subunit [Rhodospirillales bacterium]|nr:ETC complex I subunit [Rhodospirillales bacterium]